MKKRGFISSVRHHRLIRRPMRLSSVSFDDLFDEFSAHWEEKAKRLQARRWRKIKHQLI